MLILLKMTNNILMNKSEINLLYSTTKYGKSFHALAREIKGYKGPLIYLIKNKFHTVEKENQTGIFGAFSDCTICDQPTYFGNAKNFLFSLSPHFQTFYNNGLPGREFMYLNT